MSSANTAFKVENGLYVVGDATVSNSATVNNNLTINNSLIANTVNSHLIPTSNSYTIGNSTNQFTALWAKAGVFEGNLVVNTSIVTVVNVSSNATSSVLTLRSNNTQVFQNVTFDTDLLFLDAENNRIGIKNAAPSAVDLITVGAGNVFFNTANSTIRMSGTGSQNSFIGLMSNTTNARFTFSTSDSSNSTVMNGGYLFFGVNSTATYSLLSLNNTELTYKSGNVAHAGNFGIYDASGTRVGP